MFTLGETPFNGRNYPLAPDGMTGILIRSPGTREVKDDHLQFPVSWPVHQNCSGNNGAMTLRSGSSNLLVALQLRGITTEVPNTVGLLLLYISRF
jgi:hypothetical protein